MNEPLNLGRSGNRLLDAMPEPTMTLLRQFFSHVTLPQGFVCFDAGDPIDQVYFPTSGLISFVVSTEQGELVETGLIGCEGAVGLQSGLGQRLVFARAIVQIGGMFYVIPAEHLRLAFEKSEEAKALIYRYIETRLAEAQQLTACNAIHAGGARLARWLLQSADRIGSNQLPLTQEFLGEMLGIRRTSVTLLAIPLRARGVIKYSRGTITILDRGALEATACECYQVIRELYREKVAAEKEGG